MNIDDLEGDELFNFLRVNKKSLIETKKANLKLCDSVIATVITRPREVKTNSDNKDSSSEPSTDPNSLEVTVVANTANIIDSHMDMLTDEAYTDSIKTRGNSIPHLLDHVQSAVGHIGDVTKVYTQKIALKELGINKDGTTTALLMDSIVRKSYNEKAFKFYSNNKINQHSIGLTYGELKLAINSAHEQDKEEKAIWDNYYPQVINKDIADKRGYFYVVPKADVRENSAVLFGANSVTPTLSVKGSFEPINSSLGNNQEIVSTQPIGNTMTPLEEAQGKIISLTEELAKAKADIAIAKIEAKVKEKARISDILKAQAVFGSDAKLQKAALSFIEKDLDVDTAVTSFEVIKEALQSASHVESTQGKASLDEDDVSKKELSPKEQLMNIVKATRAKPDFGDIL